MRGVLFHLGQYPGWKPAGSETAWVTGELWKLRSAAATLAELDGYEGPEFRRVMEEVETESGPRLAWVYELAEAEPGAPRIESGDWFTGADSPAGPPHAPGKS